MDLSFLENKLIVFEGQDSCGKSSVAEYLINDLIGQNIKYISTFQPGDPQWGPMAPLIRGLCKDRRFNLSSFGNLFAFLLDRAENMDKIVKPSLEKGLTVLSDRWSYSTVAYQFYGKGLINSLEKELGNEKSEIVLDWLINSFSVKPDYVFYFKDKVGDRPKDLTDNFENNGQVFENRVRSAYEMMSKKYLWIEVSAGRTAAETYLNLLEELEFRSQLIV